MPFDAQGDVVQRDRSREAVALDRRNRLPNVASQMRVAFASIALKTGSSSPGELEMTFSTSDVAVCCSSDLQDRRCAGAVR